jgi:hypothetical protein
MKKERNNGRKASSEALMVPSADGDLDSRGRRQVGRRSFLKGLGLAGATLLPASALLATKVRANPGDASGTLTRGDAAILRFLAAAEILESDLWEQYWELGGVPFGEKVETPLGEPPPSFKGGNPAYIAALEILDGDMPQYITDNTDDEFSHQAFIRAYLASKGASTAEIDLLAGPTFRTIPGSTATGSAKKGRLTNLTELTIDTSFWGRYRTDNKNPEAMHFQTWQDKAGNANTNPNGPPGNPPFTVVDPVNNSTVTFFDLHFGQPETLQANLIMPEPCPFLRRSFPNCSIVRPTATKNAAMGTINAFAADGLFIGQTNAFMELLTDLAADADRAKREFEGEFEG